MTHRGERGRASRCENVDSRRDCPRGGGGVVAIRRSVAASRAVARRYRDPERGLFLLFSHRDMYFGECCPYPPVVVVELVAEAVTPPHPSGDGTNSFYNGVEWVMSFPFHRPRKEEQADLGELLTRAKAGDTGVRDQILRQYLPFVAKSASRASSRYISRGEDDEFSIALAAFNEAIDRYDDTRGSSFLGFADTVIRRRLIDYFRSKEMRVRDIPMAEFEVEDENEHTYNRIEIQKSLESYRIHEAEVARKEEIERYCAWLAEFGITLEELVDLSPKHADARWNAVQVAKVIASNPKFTEYLIQKKSLPLKELMQEVQVSRKTLERQRKYIIAIALILIGDFEMLREYIA